MQVTCKQGDEPHVRLQLVDKLDTLAERQVTCFLPWEETTEARDTAGTVGINKLDFKHARMRASDKILFLNAGISQAFGTSILSQPRF